MSTEVVMGITVEDIQERIKVINDQALQTEDFSIRSAMNDLSNALTANPDIVNELSEEDLGALCRGMRQVHADAFASQAAKAPAKAAAAKKKSAKASEKKDKEVLANVKAEDILDDL